MAKQMIEPYVSERQCRRCGQCRSMEHFGVHSRGTIRNVCKECTRSAEKDRYHRAWSESEDAKLRENYPAGNWAALRKMKRTKTDVQKRAVELGLSGDITAKPWINGNEWRLPVDDRPESVKALDYVLRDFRECEPAANLTWIIGAVA